MSGLRLVSVRHGSSRRSVVLYAAMPRAEAERLLSAAFSVPDGAALLLMDPVSKRRWTVHEACRDTAALPDVLELLTHSPAAASTTAANESRPLLHHHNQHSHRVQPYQPHSRQQSRTAHQFTQTAADELPQPQPASPLLDSHAASNAVSFPPPFVLSLHSLSDLAQALQLSEHVIVLLYIVSPAPASSTSLSRLYYQLALSARYRNLLFVSVESSLLASAASATASAGSASSDSTAPPLLPVTLPPPPALQLYYAGTCIGEVGNVNEEQLITIVQSSDELMQHIAANGSGSAGGDDNDGSEYGGQQHQRAQDSPSARVQWEEGEEEEGVLLSADEALALEKLVLREDADVQAAYASFPELSLVVDAFMRMAKHVGREKDARRRRAEDVTASTAAMPSTFSAEPSTSRTSSSQRQAAAAATSALDDLLSMTLSALQQHGLLSTAEVDGVLQLYADNSPQVVQTLLAYQRDGREEQLMENLLRIAMAHKLGMAAQLPHSRDLHSNTATEDRQARSGSSDRDWEGRDDSEGMRERRMAATESSGTRSKWASQSQRVFRPAALDNADEDDDDDEDEDEDENEEEESEQYGEDDEDGGNGDGDDEPFQDNSEALNVALGRLAIAPSATLSSSAPFLSASSLSVSAANVSSGLYQEAVNLLAALSFQQLITAEQLSLFVALLTAQHPLFLSPLLAYQQTNDVDDLLNTLNKVYARLGGQLLSTGQQHAASTSSLSSESAELADLLSLLPPSFLATHGSHLSSLIASRDAVLLSALQIWREQQQQQQADLSGGHGERQQKDTQQLLTVIMRRAEKERQRAETSIKAKHQSRPAATDSAVHASSAPFTDTTVPPVPTSLTAQRTASVSAVPASDSRPSRTAQTSVQQRRAATAATTTRATTAPPESTSFHSAAGCCTGWQPADTSGPTDRCSARQRLVSVAVCRCVDGH